MPGQPYFHYAGWRRFVRSDRRCCYQGGVPTYRRPFEMRLHSGSASTKGMHKGGPAEWPGPSRGNEPVLTLMYA